MNKADSRRITKNTFLLYFRMLLTMGVSLYTTKVVLATLGVDDFGIYNVVGGIVVLFAFLNNAMLASSQRFIAYELGCGNLDSQKKVFSSSLTIHYLIAFLLLLLALTVGMWFLNTYLNIPENRNLAANIVFIMSSLGFSINVTSVPYTASILAHEKMDVYAWISIVDAFLKLLIVYLLQVINGDKLIVYSILMLLIVVVNRTWYQLYANKNFKECRYVKLHDKTQLKTMLNFAGWSFLGNFAFSAKDYGVNIIINIFTNVAVNAARGIAYQIMNVINGFVSNFQMAVNPQIYKQYAAKNIIEMLSLVIRSSKFSFVLLSFIVIPFYIRMPFILSMWLEDVPNYTIQFLELVLIMAMINSMVGPIVVAIQATGKVKVFQIIIATIMILDIPLSCVVLKVGFAPYSVMFVAIFTAVIGLVARIIVLSRLISIVNVSYFIIPLFFNCPFSFILSFFPIRYLSSIVDDTWGGLVLITIASVFWISFVSFIVIFDNSEKMIIRNRVSSACDHLKWINFKQQ